MEDKYQHFDVTDNFFITVLLAFVRHCGGGGAVYSETVYQLCIDFKETHDSLRKELLCSLVP
jgi:hypothetical protein